ncbi:YhgE/Pip domain-containing protein [Paenibacillus sp. OV219]|uniref:YhgE/Pip domain-containing protein n=1 Tax=Paenibacillus sp. OV219 TaxID=1884377 RepID=UPI0008CCBC44|nr:YhgE/Pip domain-containing protein [Paenibacillus sp. OV219]SEO62335.1 putative membrane protein [Paenibacillus sp. OV219]
MQETTSPTSAASTISGWRLAILDIKSMWGSRAVRKSLLGLMVLPLIYSFIYLWAFWDPTARLNKLPLAIVNEDTGAKRGGEQHNLGSELVAKLIADTDTHWTEVSREQARKGIKKESYALALYLPPEFSTQAYSVSSDHPQPTRLNMELSEGSNMLQAKIVRAVADRVNDKLRKELQENYLSVIFDQVLNGAKGLQDAADGAAKLSAASEQAYKGAGELANGLTQSGGGMTKLSTGLQTITSGANELENGLVKLNAWAELASAGIDQWNGVRAASITQTALDPAKQLAASQSNLLTSLTGVSHDMTMLRGELANVKSAASDLNTLNTLVRPVQTQVSDMNNRAQTGQQLLQDLGQLNADLTSNTNYKQLAEQLGSIQSTGADAAGTLQAVTQSIDHLKSSLDQSIGQIASEAAALTPKLDQLAGQMDQFRTAADNVSSLLGKQQSAAQNIAERVRDVASGVGQLQQGSSKLMNGLLQLGSGVEALRIGNAKLGDGTASLQDGLAQMNRGQGELADKLADAAGMASTDGQAANRQAVIADPVMLEETNLHPVPSNGVGFAPYFIALSLWVGSLVLFFVIDIWRVLALPHGPLAYLGSKYVALASVSICQALLSVFILHTGLGIPTVLPPLAMYIYAMLVGLVFTAILFMLIAVLGSDTGRFVAVLILMLQLTSSSGSYPVVLEPGLFRFIHPFLPMTYAVEGLRQLISLGEWTAIIRTAGLLSGFGLCSLLLLYVFKRRSIMKEVKLA